MRSRPAAICHALAVGALPLDRLARAAEDEQSLKAKLLGSYPEALRVLETRFGKAFGTVTLSEEYWVGKPKHIRLVGQYAFASKWPDLAKVTRTAAMTTVNDEKTGMPKATVFCTNKENSLKVEFDLSKGGNKRLRGMRGWVIVAPEEKWVIREYELTDATSITRGHVDYAATGWISSSQASDYSDVRDR